MITFMATTVRPQQRYDHRLRHLVHCTGDVTIATDLGIPRPNWPRRLSNITAHKHERLAHGILRP